MVSVPGLVEVAALPVVLATPVAAAGGGARQVEAAEEKI